VIKFLNQGMSRFVSGPEYGRQDVGVAPGGAMDQFAMHTGNVLLGNQAETKCIEIDLLAPKIEFLKSGHLILTGASREALLHYEGRKTELAHGKVYGVTKGSTLTFGKLNYGLRSYLCMKQGEGTEIHRQRPPFSEIAQWVDPEQYIRVVEGPEHKYLSEPKRFFDQHWQVSALSNEMGLRLDGEKIDCELKQMISSAVCDGTVQLSPDGPIVLLRNRPTIGGYPRIFNVITADVDMLAQLPPNSRIRFKQVTLEEAKQVAIQKQKDLQFMEKGKTKKKK